MCDVHSLYKGFFGENQNKFCLEQAELKNLE